MAAAPAAQVAVRFVLYEQEVTPEVVEEAQLHRDIILVRDGDSATDYRSIVHKTWAFVEVGRARVLCPPSAPAWGLHFPLCTHFQSGLRAGRCAAGMGTLC